MENTTEKVKVIEASKVRLLKKIKRFVFIIVIILLLSSSLNAIYYFFNKENLFPNLSLITSPLSKSSSLPAVLVSEDKILAKVGVEYIYQQSVDNQIAIYPAVTAQKQIALEQLISDSIILQGGAGNGLIQLDDQFFNSQKMDLKLRTFMVEKVRGLIENQADKISGTVVSIWFLNNKAGPLGYEKAKQIALEKITKLHKNVKAGKITIDQAGQQIANDSSLAQLDPAYKSNAIFTFTGTSDQPPTFSSEMNKVLLSAKTGFITDIFTIQSGDLENHKLVDAYYSFGQVTQKISNGKIVSFDNWLNIQKGNYEVQTF